jgi:hypothetical protein
MLFGPLMAHYIFSAVLGPVRYLVVQREAAADESMLAMVEAHGEEEREAARVMAAWTREREAYRPPDMLLQISATLYRIKNQVMPSTYEDDDGYDTRQQQLSDTGGDLTVENLCDDAHVVSGTGGHAGSGADRKGATSPFGGFALQPTIPEDVFGHCQICFEDDAVADSVLLPCGHGGVCRECAEKLVSRDPQCHMCRHKVLRVASVAPAGVDVRTGLMEVEVLAATTMAPPGRFGLPGFGPPPRTPSEAWTEQQGNGSSDRAPHP